MAGEDQKAKQSASREMVRAHPSAGSSPRRINLDGARTCLEDVEADVSSRECDVWVEARGDELDGGCGVRVVGGEVEGDPEREPRVRLQPR